MMGRDLSMKKGIFSVCAPPTPPPPQYVMHPPLQSTCHYIVIHYVKMWHVRLGDAINIRPLSWRERGGGGGGGVGCGVHKRKRSKKEVSSKLSNKNSN